MNDNPNEYYQRIVRLKPIIEADEGMMRRIAQVFDIEYQQPPAHRLVGGRQLPDGVIELGKCGSHEVFGIGKIVDPLNARGIHLQVRLRHDCKSPYETAMSEFLWNQVGAYEQSFINQRREQPLYFAGVVVSSLPAQFQGSFICGMICEDVSHGKEFTIFSPTDEEYIVRFKDGKEERFMVDPETNKEYPNGAKYFSNEARIDVK